MGDGETDGGTSFFLFDSAKKKKAVPPRPLLKKEKGARSAAKIKYGGSLS
jgi:hypothetical protein